MKTIIPGAEPQHNNSNANPLYAPTPGNNGGKTYIPDVHRRQNDTVADEGHEKKLKLQDRTIAGILFSISRTSSGEIFPIYLGRNTIGSHKDCDVWLGEETVSPSHAVLAVRRIQNEDGSILFQASITDYESKFGTLVGDEKLEYDKVECYNGDIITVGRHYQLLLYLFDTVGNDLYVDEEFKALERPKDEEDQAPAFRMPERFSLEAIKEEPVNTRMTDSEVMSFYAPSKRKKSTHSSNTTAH